MSAINGQADHKTVPSDSELLMIPGPIEYHEDVLRALSAHCDSHVSPTFIEVFGQTIEMSRAVFLTKKESGSQPFILCGSGSLGWDCIASNFVEAGEHALVVNTGYFGDSFTTCLATYGAQVDQLPASSIGETVSLAALEHALTQRTYKLVTITHVDTSTGVRNDIKAMCRVIREKSPGSLIAVDGVCSVGAEELRFDDWGVDLAMTSSQKALGVPPGLMILMASRRAITVLAERKTAIPSYYANLRNWLPIMNAYENRQPSYFATPAVSLIKALHVSFAQLLSTPGGMDAVFSQQLSVSQRIHRAIKAMGLTMVPANPLIAAATLSAIRFPSGVKGPEFLGKVRANGVMIAGGLHRQIKSEYFRVGHMGLSALDDRRQDIAKTLAAIEAALIACGHACPAGTAVAAFDTN